MIPPEIPANEAERLKTLYQLKILDTEREERFDRITRIACKLFTVPIAVVSFMEFERQWMKSTQGFDIKEAIRKTSFCGHVILSDTIMIVEDATKDRRFHDNPFVLGKPYFRFYLGCPIQINKCNVGTFCLIDDRPRLTSDFDQSSVYDLTQMLELELETLNMSTTDELTGLSNRRGFLKITEPLFEKCQRDHQIFSLLFFDLDKFKQINDLYGHAEGDEVLKVFSQTLLEHFRGYDAIARLGGDEFCVFCSGLTSADVNKVISRVRHSLKAKKNKEYDILFSVGSVQYDKNKYNSLKSMLEFADAKMYHDKEERRKVLR